MSAIRSLLKTVAEKAQNPALLRYGGGGLLGTGIAQLENTYLGEYLPEELKKINLGVGATTGLLGASGPKGLSAALKGLPFKQMGLFGIGEMAQARREKSKLMGLDIERALTELDTAGVNARAADVNAQGANLRNVLFGALAGGSLLGGGALAAEQIREALKKRRTSSRSRYKTIGSKGTSSRAKDKLRIRIDLPSGKEPPELLRSLVDLDEAEGAHTQVRRKEAAYRALFSGAKGLLRGARNSKTLAHPWLMGSGGRGTGKLLLAGGGVGGGSALLARTGSTPKPKGFDWGGLLSSLPQRGGNLLGHNPIQSRLQSWYPY